MPQDEYAEKIVSAVVKRLAEDREAQGLSKNRLAILANVDPKTVAFVENEQRSPTLHTLVKISNALDVDLSQHLRDAKRDHPDK